MVALRKLADTEERDEDGIVFLHDVSWSDFELLLGMRGDHSGPRLTYLEGEVEIMSPSRNHEQIKSFIGLLVATWCLERGVEFSPYGAWTLKSKSKKRGAEPDECYLFGAQNRNRPDLAIEVVWTRGRIDKLEVYRKLGVREVWYWRDGNLQAHVLRGERYRPVSESTVLPGIDLAELARFVSRPTASEAIREYRAALGRSKMRRR